MKWLVFLLCFLFSNNAYASVENIAYQLKRLADAQEDENRLTACLSRVNLYSHLKDMLREQDCVKFIERMSKDGK